MSRERHRKLNETWKADELTETISKYKDERRSSRHKSSKDDRRKNENDSDLKKSRRSEHSSRQREQENGHRRSKRNDDGYEDGKENRHHHEKESRKRDEANDRRRLDYQSQKKDKDRRERRDERDPRRPDDEDRERRRRDDKDSRRREDDREHKKREDDRDNRKREERDSRRKHEDDRNHRKREDKGLRRHEDDKKRDDVDSRRRKENREHRRDGDREYKRREDKDSRRRDDREHRNDGDREYKRREDKDSRRRDDREHRRRDDKESRRRDDDRDNGRREDKHRNPDRISRHKDDRDSKRLSKEDEKRTKHRDRDDRRREEKHWSDDRSEQHRDNKDEKKSYRRNISPEESRNQEENYDYDDEEFEDYASDFEDDVASNDEVEVLNHIHANSEISELARAIEEENMRATSQQNSRYGSASTAERNASPFINNERNNQNYENDSTDNSRDSSPVPFINFKAASKKAVSSKVQSGMLKRFRDLRSIITLETAAYDMYDVKPVTEYNIYIKNFGNSNTSQVATQCNDDNLEQEIQTNSPEMTEKWSQHPPTDIRVCGDGLVDNSNNDEYNKRMMAALQADGKRFSKFIKSSCNLFLNIIAEENAWVSSLDNKNQSSYSFCESYSKIQTNLGYLQGRKVVHAAFSPVINSAYIAVCFDPAAKEYSTRVDRKGIIVVWDTKKPITPEKVLVCDTRPTYCCFCPFKSHLLFVGTEDGCVLAFDLKEPSSNHQLLALEKGPETALRSATYNTGCMNDIHSSVIVSIAPVTAGVVDSFMNDDVIPDALNTGTAFQIASLEELGYLCIWIVIESNVELDAESDLGLSPHGKVKLIKSLKICVSSPVRPNFSDVCFRVNSVVFSPSDANHFYVATDTGHIAHMTQFANGQSKKIDYLSNGADYLSAVSTLDIAYLPDFSKTLLLAGFEDGNLELYVSGRKSPVLSWPYSTNGHGIKVCKWSTCRPSVFYVLDNSHQLHIWDLIIQPSAPVKTENMADKKLLQFCVSKPNLKKDFLKTKPEIALIHSAINDKASVEVHSLSAHFSNPVDNENEQLMDILCSSM